VVPRFEGTGGGTFGDLLAVCSALVIVTAPAMTVMRHHPSAYLRAPCRPKVSVDPCHPCHSQIAFHRSLPSGQGEDLCEVQSAQVCTYAHSHCPLACVCRFQCLCELDTGASALGVSRHSSGTCLLVRPTASLTLSHHCPHWIMTVAPDCSI
jgi:hypothetical protein